MAIIAQLPFKKATSCLIVMYLLWANLASAQVNFSSVSNRQLDPSICWNVRVQVMTAGERVELTGKIFDDNGKVLIECVSDKLMLRNGLNDLNYNMVRTTNVRFFDDEVKKHLQHYGTLPPGRYQFCTMAKTVADHEELGEDCISLTQASNPNLNVDGKAILKKFQFYGNASVEHIYATRQGTNQVIPPHLLRVQAQPGISFYTLPFGMNLFYTTERTSTRPNQFAVSFNFDAEKFKSNLRTLVEQKLFEQTKINTANLSKQYEQIADLENINQKLSGISSNSAEITSLEEKIKSADYSNLDQSLANLNTESNQALEKINYQEQRDEFQNTLNKLSEYVPQDSTEEKQKQLLTDILNRKIERLEIKKDSTIQSTDKNPTARDSLAVKKKQLDKMVSQLETLKMAAEQYQQLSEKKDYLEGIQSSLDGASKNNLTDLDRLNDPTILKQNLQEQGMFTGVNKLFFGVRQLSIGTVYPYYSSLLMNGIQVQGGALEINPGIFFLNVTGGNTDLGTGAITDIFKSAHQRWMLGGRIGLGKVERSHFFVSYIHSFDKKDANSTPFADSLRRKQNDVAGAEFQLTFLQGRIKLYSEVATSSFNRNQDDVSLVVNNQWYEQIPDFLRPNLSTSYDYAYTVRGDFSLWQGSLITLYNEYIGPGYTSFGVPFLRNDVLRYGGRVEQGMWKSRLKLRGKYRYEIDNLIVSKRTTSTTHFYGAGLSYNQKKVPTLRADYNGNRRNNAFNQQQMNSVSLSSGYSYKVSKKNLRTGINYQWMMSTADSISAAEYQLHNVSLNQSFSFVAPVTLLLTAGFNRLTSQLQANNQIQLGTGLVSSPVKGLNTALNIDVFKNLGKELRLGASLDVSYLFLKYFTISTGMRYNSYQNVVPSDAPFNEFVLVTKLMAVW